MTPPSSRTAAGWLDAPLLLASTNRHKRAELEDLFAPTGIALQSADACGLHLPEVAEDGESVEQNAMRKARAVAAATGRTAIADDTVLEVDALGGRPGLLTARFAGPGASAQQNIDKLLRQMRDVPAGQRSARFVCCLCIAAPHRDRVLCATGSCQGRILRQPQGGGGFGYDAYFWIDAVGCTMAELSPEARRSVTHRAAAFRQLAQQLGLKR